MSTLISSLLDLSKLTSIDLKLTEFDLSELIAEVMDDLRKMDPIRQVQVNIQAKAHVYGDPRLFKIAMENLLRNSWKFSKNRGLTQIDFTFSSPAPGKVVYCLKDNGAGFDMSQAHQPFRPFSRLHENTNFEGSGVGLALVSRIISRHGGKIWAQSEIDKGTEIYFKLPATLPG